MEPEGSLPNSHVPVICPYPEPAWSSPYPTSHFLKIYLSIILPSASGSPHWSLSLRFPHQNPVHASPPSSIRATCPVHLILLDFITQKILGEGYRSTQSNSMPISPWLIKRYRKLPHCSARLTSLNKLSEIWNTYSWDISANYRTAARD